MSLKDRSLIIVSAIICAGILGGCSKKVEKQPAHGAKARGVEIPRLLLVELTGDAIVMDNLRAAQAMKETLPEDAHELVLADYAPGARRVMSLDEGARVPEAAKRGDLFITPLWDALMEEHQRIRHASRVIADSWEPELIDGGDDDVPARPELDIAGRLALVVDDGVPFETLLAVIYTAGQAEFSELVFVLGRSGDSAEELIIYQVARFCAAPPGAPDHPETRACTLLDFEVAPFGVSLLAKPHEEAPYESRCGDYFEKATDPALMDTPTDLSDGERAGVGELLDLAGRSALTGPSIPLGPGRCIAVSHASGGALDAMARRAVDDAVTSAAREGRLCRESMITPSSGVTFAQLAPSLRVAAARTERVVLTFGMRDAKGQGLCVP